MIVSQSIKDKYPDWEYLVSLLPQGVIGISKTYLGGEVRLETEFGSIYISEEIFTDDLVLRELVERYLVKPHPQKHRDTPSQ